MAFGLKNLIKDALPFDLEDIFKSVAKVADPKGDGKVMPQTAVEDWLSKTDSGIGQADVAGAFQKLGKKSINFDEFGDLLKDMAAKKSLDLDSVKDKLLKFVVPK